jgi:hypothetical protein
VQPYRELCVLQIGPAPAKAGAANGGLSSSSRVVLFCSHAARTAAGMCAGLQSQRANVAGSVPFVVMMSVVCWAVGGVIGSAVWGWPC